VSPSHRRGSPAARAAGLLFLPFPLALFVTSLGAQFVDRSVASGCIDYCDLDRDFGRIGLVLGGIGIGIAVLIWRRHVAAMALALFLTALMTGFWLIAIVPTVVVGQFGLLLHPAVLAAGALVIAADACLVAAMRVEMNAAGEQAVADLTKAQATTAGRSGD